MLTEKVEHRNFGRLIIFHRFTARRRPRAEGFESGLPALQILELLSNCIKIKCPCTGIIFMAPQQALHLGDMAIIGRLYRAR